MKLLPDRPDHQWAGRLGRPDVLLDGGGNAGTTFFLGGGTAPLKFGRAKTSTIYSMFCDNFRL